MTGWLATGRLPGFLVQVKGDSGLVQASLHEAQQQLRLTGLVIREAVDPGPRPAHSRRQKTDES